MTPTDLPAPPVPSKPRFVSVVVPCADEAENVGELTRRIHEVLSRACDEYEIIVVVPGPDDPTGPAAAAAGARVLHQKRPGYGGALKEGLLAARGDWVVTMDGDLSHPPEQIEELLARRHDAEVVVCSRYVPGASAEVSMWRAFLSWVLNRIYGRVLAIPVLDSSSGFRVYRRHVFDEIEFQGEKYDILQEILVQIYCRGWRVIEIPFAYAPRAAGESHARPLQFAPHFLTTLLKLFRLRNHFDSADYDSRAYDSIVWPQRYWQRKRFEWIQRMADHPGQRLDVGCGSSRIIQSRPDAIGMDLSLPKLRFLRKTNPRLVRATTYALPIASDSIDVLVHSQVIEHIPYDRSIFTEMNRVLRKGGTLVVGTPDYGRVQWRVTEALYGLLMPSGYADDHVTHYTRQSLIEELARVGFGIRRYAYVGGGELIIEAVKREDLPAAG